MSVQLAHPPLPGEAPFDWSVRVLRDFYPKSAAVRPASIRQCAYCGQGTYGLIACRRHRDLPARDPFFNPEDFRPEALLDRLVTTGA